MKIATLLATLAAGAAPVLGCLQVHCPVDYCATSLDNALSYARDRLNGVIVSGQPFIGRDGITWDGTAYYHPGHADCPSSGLAYGNVVVWRGRDDGKGIRQSINRLEWVGPNGRGTLGPCWLKQTVNC